MASRPPPLLSPYLALPPETSLLLLTSVLGAGTNWLLLRYLQSFLSPQVNQSPEDAIESPEARVVLVSFLRDFSLWNEGSRKLGLDLGKLGANGRFAYIDGLTGLFSETVENKLRDNSKNEAAWQTVLRTGRLDAVSIEILKSVERLKKEGSGQGKVVLVIDGLDFLLASRPKYCTPAILGDMVMDLREHVHATVLAISDDDPLVKRQATELEVNHAAFILNVAHQADLTMSLRLLDTGTARDVSGVVRIAVQGDVDEARDTKLEGRELLYFVGGDASVRVFERGQ